MFAKAGRLSMDNIRNVDWSDNIFSLAGNDFFRWLFQWLFIDLRANREFFVSQKNHFGMESDIFVMSFRYPSKRYQILPASFLNRVWWLIARKLSSISVDSLDSRGGGLASVEQFFNYEWSTNQPRSKKHDGIQCFVLGMPLRRYERRHFEEASSI